MHSRTLQKVYLCCFVVAFLFVYRHVSAKSAQPLPIKRESPHLRLKLDPKFPTADQPFEVYTELRGYDLGEGTTFCLRPKWVLFARDLRGAPIAIEDDKQPIQCSNHSYRYRYTLRYAGDYKVGLYLYTTSTRVRVQEFSVIEIEVGEKR